MNEPDLIQRLSVEFNVVSDLTLNLNNTTSIEAEFGTVYTYSNSKLVYATTATWNSRPQLIAERGYMYIYSDWKQDEQGRDVPGLKCGDGTSYLIDMPFTDGVLWEHIGDSFIHITQAERESWNNKITCDLSDIQNGNLIFTKD